MKILLAADGSDHSALAEEILIKFPGIKGAEISVATVTPTPTVFAGLFQPVAESSYLQESAEVWSNLRERSRQIASEAAKRLRSQGANATEVMLDGDPGNELLRYTDSHPFDLVVLGSRGENAVAAALLGSVARKLLSHCKASVLVARHYAHLDPVKSRELLSSKKGLRALVSVDGSAGSEAAISFIQGLGSNAFEKLTVFSVEPLIMINTVYDPVVSPIIVTPQEANAARTADEAAAKLAKSANEIISAHDIGRPGNLIISNAATGECDLVVIGAYGHGALDRMLLGSVSYEVATTAPCSVLVVRPK